MVSFKSLFLFATLAISTVLATPAPANPERDLLARGGSDPLQKALFKELINLDHACLNLTKAVSKYKGGLLGASPILVSLTALHNANRKSTLALLALKQPANAAASLEIVNYFAATLARDIPAATSRALVQKKALLVKSGLRASVLASLDLLRFDYGALGTALKQKTSKGREVQKKVGIVVSVIDGAIGQAVKAFSSR